MFATLFKILNVFVLSVIKYFWAPAYSYMFGFSWFETLMIVVVTGLLSFTFFYKFSKWILITISRIKERLNVWYPRKIDQKRKNNKVKINTSVRRLIWFKMKYGSIGIVFLTPFLLSIPVGAFLSRKYFSREPHLLTKMYISIVAWGILSTVLFKHINFLHNII